MSSRPISLHLLQTSLAELDPSPPHKSFGRSSSLPAIAKSDLFVYYCKHCSSHILITGKMTSKKDQKGKAVAQEGQKEPSKFKPDFSQTVIINGWDLHDPLATAKPTPAAPGTYLSRRQRRERSKQHYKKKIAEEQRHLEALAKLSQEEASKRPYNDLVRWWSLEDGEDPTAKPVKKLQVPKRVQEYEDK